MKNLSVPPAWPGPLPAATPPSGMAIYQLPTGSYVTRANFAFKGGAFRDKRSFAATAILVTHPQGDFLIDARDTWTTYEVDPNSGNVVWQLGGKDSSFTLQAAPGQVLDSANEIFAWQHDPEPLGNGKQLTAHGQHPCATIQGQRAQHHHLHRITAQDASSAPLPNRRTTLKAISGAGSRPRLG